MWIRSAGFQVFTANDSTTAMSALCARKYEVVLCDLMMPGKSGVQLISIFRKWEAENRPAQAIQRIFALTAYTDVDTWGCESEWGMQGVLIKPLDIRKLNSVCQNLPQDSACGILTLPFDTLCDILLLSSPDHPTFLAQTCASFSWLVERTYGGNLYHRFLSTRESQHELTGCQLTWVPQPTPVSVRDKPISPVVVERVLGAAKVSQQIAEDATDVREGTRMVVRRNALVMS